MKNIITILDAENNTAICNEVEYEELINNTELQKNIVQVINNNGTILIIIDSNKCDWGKRGKLIKDLDKIMNKLGATFIRDTREYCEEVYVKITLFYMKAKELYIEEGLDINENQNKNIISFISCVTDEKMFSVCCSFINKLKVPDGFSIEIIPVRNVHSITSGYNIGMKKAKGKYKIYLHQDVYIFNEDIISNILNIFKDESIGLIGVIGSKNIALNGMWAYGAPIYGTAYDTEKGKIITHTAWEPIGEYEEVSLVDGIIMITQHDVFWREDKFDGWHCYDASQSTEMKLSGKKVVIPKQINPWVLHNNKGGHAPGFENDKCAFYYEYAPKGK